MKDKYLLQEMVMLEDIEVLEYRQLEDNSLVDKKDNQLVGMKDIVKRQAVQDN